MTVHADVNLRDDRVNLFLGSLGNLVSHSRRVVFFGRRHAPCAMRVLFDDLREGSTVTMIIELVL